MGLDALVTDKTGAGFPPKALTGCSSGNKPAAGIVIRVMAATLQMMGTVLMVVCIPFLLQKCWCQSWVLLLRIFDTTRKKASRLHRTKMTGDDKSKE